MRICAATGNAGKLRELRRILEAQGHEVVSQKELGITIEPDETGTTFEANALIKAETICKASGLPTIADDSGLCVDALDGAPGVYSARYCGHHGDDEANNDKLLENMKDVPAGSAARSSWRRSASSCPPVSTSPAGRMPGPRRLRAAGRGLRLRLRPALHPRRVRCGQDGQAPQLGGPQLCPADSRREGRHQSPRKCAGGDGEGAAGVFGGKLTSPSLLRNATSPTEGRPWHFVKLRLFARGSPTRGAVCEAD